jgi:hypothetical protein
MTGSSDVWEELARIDLEMATRKYLFEYEDDGDEEKEPESAIMDPRPAIPMFVFHGHGIFHEHGNLPFAMESEIEPPFASPDHFTVVPRRPDHLGRKWHSSRVT